MASAPSKTLLEGKGFSCELEAIGQAKKDKEFDVLHLEHTLQRHRDQKGEGTDPSVNNWISDGGRRIVRLKQFGVEMYCCLSSRE